VSLRGASKPTSDVIKEILPRRIAAKNEDIIAMAGNSENIQTPAL